VTLTDVGESAKDRRDRESVVSAEQAMRAYGYRCVDALTDWAISCESSEIRQAALLALDELFKLLPEEPAVKRLDDTRESLASLNATIDCWPGSAIADAALPASKGLTTTTGEYDSTSKPQGSLLAQARGLPDETKKCTYADITPYADADRDRSASSWPARAIRVRPPPEDNPRDEQSDCRREPRHRHR
jgi:hypothetical protein